MTIQDIVTEFGNYYINQQQNASRLVRLLYRPSVTEQLFTPIVTDDTVWRMAKTAFSRLLQPFQKSWTPIGEMSAAPISILQYNMKADVEETPDTLKATWLGFLASNDNDRKAWPFVRWMIEAHLLPKIQEEYELNEIYAGVYAAPATGVAGASGTSMNGIRKQLNDLAAGGRITTINLGAIPTSPLAYCEYIEAFADAFSRRYANVPMYINVNETLAQRYARGKRDKYGRDINQTAPNQLINGNVPLDSSIAVEFTRHRVVGLPSMGSSTKTWASPGDNMVKLSKASVNMSQFMIESIDRRVKLFTDFWKGVGFYLPEAIFMTDQDLI